MTRYTEALIPILCVAMSGLFLGLMLYQAAQGDALFAALDGVLFAIYAAAARPLFQGQSQ